MADNEVTKQHECEHTGRLERERFLGADTGDKVCTACGAVLSPDEVKQIKRD